MALKNGFYTALGTPLDENGKVVKASLERHIEQQIEAGAAGLLLMGSMGIEPMILNETYGELVDIAVNAVNGRLPLFVGAMDNSIAKVKEKMDMLKGKKIDGIVLTTPYYWVTNEAELTKWFLTLADYAPAPLYLYDLAVVTKTKITLPLIKKIAHHKNLAGIKTADIQMLFAMSRDESLAHLEGLYSGLDTFDYANMVGVRKNLDGMFCCTPANGKKMYEALAKDDFKTARACLDNILYFRDTMAANQLFACFSYAMNLLGCEGNFGPDYTPEISEERKELVRKVMVEIGEL